MGERAGQSRIIGECHHSSSAQRFELDFNDEPVSHLQHLGFENRRPNFPKALYS